MRPNELLQELKFIPVEPGTPMEYRPSAPPAAPSATVRPIQLVPRTPTAPDLASALEVLDDFRAKIAAGEVAGFALVAIDADDDAIRGWSATVKPISRLKMAGAISTLLHDYHNGELG